MAQNDFIKAPSLSNRSLEPKIWTLLTARHRYEKTVSTYERGKGEYIWAPILAYLIETPNGRILYDLGCDYNKIADPKLNSTYFDCMRPEFDPPIMTEDQRIPNYLARLGLSKEDMDVIFLSHLHFDHSGGISDFEGCEVHCHVDELATAKKTTLEEGVFADEISTSDQWRMQRDEYEVAPGVWTVNTPGHSAGHMSMLVHLGSKPPVLICGDAADLSENIVDEVAPGYCWDDNYEQGIASIRKMKKLGAEENAELWPTHDMAFFETLPQFPEWKG